MRSCLWFTSPKCDAKSSQDVPHLANIDLDDQAEPCLARGGSTMHTRCEPSHAANIVDGLSFTIGPRAGTWWPANDQFDRADLCDGQQPKHVAAHVESQGRTDPRRRQEDRGCGARSRANALPTCKRGRSAAAERRRIEGGAAIAPCCASARGICDQGRFVAGQRSWFENGHARRRGAWTNRFIGPDTVDET